MPSFLRHAGVYGLASLLLQVGNFLLLPLYLRCLAPEEYGLLGLVTRAAEVTATVLLFGGFRQALMAFHAQAETEDERRRVVSSALLLCLFTMLLGGAGAWLLSQPASAAMTSHLGEVGSQLTPGMLRLALFAMLLEPFAFVPTLLMQARTQSGAYLVSQIVHFTLRVTLCVVLVRGYALGVLGVVLATFVSAAVMGAALTAIELRRGLRMPDGKTLRGLLAFALPMVPGGLCVFVLHQGDAFFLAGRVGDADLGTYALGYTLAMTVNRFAFAPLYMVWSVRMYDAAKQPDAADLFGRAVARMLGVYAFAGLALVLAAPEIVRVLGGTAYAGATAVVGPVFLACWFQAAATLFDGAFYVRRLTARKLPLTLAATALMVALYLWLIPAHGTFGAATATAVGFGFLAVVTYFASRKLLPMALPWARLVRLALVVVPAALVGTYAPAGVAGFAVRAALWPVAFAACLAAGVLDGADKSELLNLFSTMARRLRPAAPRAVSAAGEPAGTVPPVRVPDLPSRVQLEATR